METTTVVVTPKKSFFTRIIVDVEHFFKDVENITAGFCRAFVLLFKKAPNALQVVDNFISVLAPVVTAAVGMVNPVLEPEVALALGTVETALAGLQAAASAAVSGTSFLSALKNFEATIPQLLTSLDIKDVKLKAKIEWIANFVTGELAVLIPAVEKWVAQLEAAATPSTITNA